MTTFAKAESVAVEPEVSKPSDLLVSILRTKRAHNSNGDVDFRLWLHSYIKKLGHKYEILAEGCILVRTDKKSDTLFSCHVDTCHTVEESNGSMQELAYDETFGHIVLQKGQTSACLGADDGIGIYIMLRMIEANVPGSYIFHSGEERGGIGSRAVLAKSKALLDEFSRAIAFDRPRGEEVIVTQGGQPCASVQAGEAIVAELAKQGMTYHVSHKGSFTDTKVYAGVIPECFNLGVGYDFQHSPHEYCDVGHTEKLVKAAIAIKWDEIPTVRKPVDWTPPVVPKASKGQQSFDAGWEWPKVPAKTAKVKASKPAYEPPEPDLLEEVAAYGFNGLLEFCADQPEDAARMMMQLASRLRAANAQVEYIENFLGT